MVDTRNSPRSLPPKLDPRRPRTEAENPLWDRIRAAVDQFGQSSSPTRSKRHGHEPQARGHVEAYLSHSVLGLSVRQIAHSRRRAVSTTHQAIARGRRLVQAGAEARGFHDGGRLLVRDLDDARGFSAPDAAE